jgi:hypothetical protein
MAAVARSGTLTNDNLLVYDITGANPSPFDKDSGQRNGKKLFPSLLFHNR